MAIDLRPSASEETAGRVKEALETGRKRVDSVLAPSPISARREQSGLLVAILALVGFGIIFAVVRRKRSAATDLAITMRFQRRRHPWLRRLMAVISWPGFPPQSRLIPPLLAGAFWMLGRRVEAVFQAAAWGTTFLSFFFKRLMRRPRPDHPEIRVAIANIGGTSFPSGHVLGYMGVYGFLAFLAHTMIRPAALRRAIVGGLLWLISLVGASRVYLGHHWFTDVVASYFLGLAYLIGIISVYRRVKQWLAEE